MGEEAKVPKGSPGDRPRTADDPERLDRVAGSTGIEKSGEIGHSRYSRTGQIPRRQIAEAAVSGTSVRLDVRILGGELREELVERRRWRQEGGVDFHEEDRPVLGKQPFGSCE